MKISSYLQPFDGVELAVRQRGNGMPLVWGHALLGSIRVDDQAGIWQWDEIEKHARLVRYDARGHGNSDGSYDPGDYCWDHLAGDMLCVAHSVAPAKQRYVLGGASMGCCTALEAALQAPERVAGLVLVLPPTAWRTRRKQSGIYRRQAWMSGAFGATPYRLLKFLPAADTTQIADARRRLSLTTARELALANPLHVQAALRGAERSDLPSTGTLRQLDMPTIIFSWKGDRTHPVSTAKILADTLPNVHSLTISDPGEIGDWTQKLCGFLDQLNTGRRRKSAA